MTLPELRAGDQLPALRTAVPGPRSRELTSDLHRLEAPGINTLASSATPIIWRSALGANVLDVDHNRFVDLSSGFGVAALGHRHPVVEAAVDRQRQHLVHGLGDLHAHPSRIALAEQLAHLAPQSDAQIYWAISGADAVEVALKSALLASRRPSILAFEGGYHGTTLGAVSVTGRQSFRSPFLAQLNPHVGFLPFGASGREIEAFLTREGGVGAVLVEPIQGRAGIQIPPSGWLAELRSLTRRHGTLLIVDEILTGGGRTGPFFASEAEAVEPDLLCCGKAISGGYPIAAVLGGREILGSWPDEAEAIHTATFIAHPVACAAALATISELRKESTLGLFAGRTLQLERGLARIQSGSNRVREIRGRGLLWGVQLASGSSAVTLCQRLLERGVIALPSGPAGDVLELLPPYTITSDQLTACLEALSGALAEAP